MIMTIKMMKIAVVVIILLLYVICILYRPESPRLYKAKPHLLPYFKFVFSHMIKWLTANSLVINLVETNIMKFITKDSAHSAVHVGYKEKYIEETQNFLV